MGFCLLGGACVWWHDGLKGIAWYREDMRAKIYLMWILLETRLREHVYCNRRVPAEGREEQSKDVCVGEVWD
jgi:hypothetical protein